MKKLLLLCVLFILSCGSRKVENAKTQTKEVIKIDSTAKVIEKQTIKTVIKKNIDKEDYYYKPIDPKTEFIVDGKVYKNVEIRHKKQKDYTNVAQVKRIDKASDIALKKQSNNKVRSELKISDKKGLDFAAKIGIIIVAIGLIVSGGYLYMNK
jgi:hypothetical protein